MASRNLKLGALYAPDRSVSHLFFGPTRAISSPIQSKALAIGNAVREDNLDEAHETRYVPDDLDGTGSPNDVPSFQRKPRLELGLPTIDPEAVPRSRSRW